MNALPGMRRAAVELAQHAGAVLPGPSPWAEAMRRELDYITDDRAALAWALGCVVASYKAGLAARAKALLGRPWRSSRERNRHPVSFSGPRVWEVLRHAAAGSALMLAVGLAILDNGGGQAAPAPSPPVLDETACGKADEAPDLGRNPASGAVPGRSTPGLRCADRHAPVRVQPTDDAR